jgi:hypothetical protein
LDTFVAFDITPAYYFLVSFVVLLTSPIMCLMEHFGISVSSKENVFSVLQYVCLFVCHELTEDAMARWQAGLTEKKWFLCHVVLVLKPEFDHTV